MKKSFIAFLSAFLLFLAGCASSKFPQAEFDSCFESGDYGMCAQLLEKSKMAENIDTAIDISLLKNYAGDYKGSAEYFSMTNRAIDEAFTKSITKGVGAALGNEKAADYDGNAYEYLLVNAFNSLNYYNQGNIEDALVEIRMLENKQKEYMNRYGELVLSDMEDTSSAQSSAKSLGIRLENYRDALPEKPGENDVYMDSSFAHYLATLMYLSDGSGDPELHEKEYRALNPNGANLNDDFSIPRGMGRLDVIALAGKIKERIEGKVEVPFYIYDIPEMNPHLKYVWPTVSGVPDGNYTVKVSVVGGDSQTLGVVENFDHAVNKDVASKASKAFARSFIRSTVKEAGVVASAVITYNACDSDFLRQLALIAIGPSINAINLTETADLRQAKYLPGMAAGGGFTLDPGTYSIVVEYFNNGILMGTEEIDDIQIRANKITLVESVFVK